MEKSAFYRKRRNQVTQFMPTMISQSRKLSHFDERIEALVADPTRLSEMRQLLDELLLLNMETRPNFHKDRVAKLEAVARQSLQILDAVEERKADLSMSDFTVCEEAIVKLMTLSPEAADYPRRKVQCRNLVQVVGTMNLKKDVVGKGDALEKDITSVQKSSEFSQLASLMHGVDLTEKKAEVSSCSLKVLQHCKDGHLNECEETFVEGLLDAYATVASAAGALQESNTLQLKQKELKAKWALDKVHKMGAGAKEITTNAASTQCIEQLRLKANDLASTNNELQKKGGLLEEFANTELGGQCQQLLTILGKHEMAVADDRLKKVGKELHPKVGVDPKTYENKWACGITDFADLAKVAETDLAPESSVSQLAQDFTQVFELVVSLSPVFFYVVLSVSIRNLICSTEVFVLCSCLQAHSEAVALRAKYAENIKMPEGNWDALRKNAEVARFAQYVVGAIKKKSSNAGYTNIHLKNDLVKEMKIVRGVVGDEKQWLPKPLLSEVLSLVWTAKCGGE